MKRTQGMWFVCILKAHGGPRGKAPWSTQHGWVLTGELGSRDTDHLFPGWKRIRLQLTQRGGLLWGHSIQRSHIATDNSPAEGRPPHKGFQQCWKECRHEDSIWLDYHLIFWTAGITFGAKWCVSHPVERREADLLQNRSPCVSWTGGPVVAAVLLESFCLEYQEV